MSFKNIILFSLIILLSLSCSKIDDSHKEQKDDYEKYFQLIKVNNDLTLTGINEIKEDQLEGEEYFHFFYKNKKLVKIISNSSLANSFHELNKYIFNINKEFREIHINKSQDSIEYTFLNNKELIKFIISYNDDEFPLSFQVIPFNLTYDNFNILGRSVVYTGEIYSQDSKIKSIKWGDSKAEYKFDYDSKSNLVSKRIYNNESILYEYIYKLGSKGVVVGIK